MLKIGQDILYVVANEDRPQNFIFYSSQQSGQSQSSSSSDKLKASAAAGAAGAAVAFFPFLSLPTALVIAGAAASPLIAKLFASNQKEIPKELETSSIEAFKSFVNKNICSLDEVREFGAQFPPGHPQAGETYKLHPLAHVAGVGKEKVYVPKDLYEEMLLAEREGELLKLLVHLGATRISIAKKIESSTYATLQINAGGDAQGIATANISANTSTQQAVRNSDTRIFELAGRPWLTSDRISRKDYSWANFEPSWIALIEAREIGGCTKATLEMRGNSSYSLEKEISADVKAKIYAAHGGISTEKRETQEIVFLIEVDFSIPKAG